MDNFFYNLNDKLNSICATPDVKNKQLNEDRSAQHQPDLSESAVEESGLQAYLGKKKYGKEGMQALQKAGREGAGKEKMANIRARHDKMDEADMEEGNDGNLANNAKPYDKVTRGDVIAGRLGKDEMGGKQKMTQEGRKEQTKTGIRHHGTYGTDYQGDDDQEENKKTKHVKHDRAGRPSGPKHTYDAPFGKVKLPPFTGKRTVHTISDTEPGKEPPRRGRPSKVKEEMDDKMIHPADRGEYDREGDMAKTKLRTAKDAASELRSILDSDENLPEWVQNKINLAVDYLDTARDYMKSKKSDAAEPIAEKAASQAQQQAAAIALNARRQGKKTKSGTASAEMAQMPKNELEKFAKTKTKNLPKHVDEKVQETTTSGSVAVSDNASTTKSKSKGGVSFGKGIYDSWNRDLEQMISESINITVTQNTNETGEIDKSISVNATGEDADRLAELLNLSGMHSDHGEQDDHSCSVCGQEPCGCADIVDENSPDWPTNTEYNDDSLQYSGGLNRPKSTGQTTVPVVASQLDRQMSEDQELSYIKKMLG